MSAWYNPEQEDGIRARLPGADRVSLDIGDIAESNGLIYGWKLGDAQDGSDKVLLSLWVILAEEDVPARTLAKERGMVVTISSDVTVGGDGIAAVSDGGTSGRADGGGTGMSGPEVADDASAVLSDVTVGGGGIAVGSDGGILVRVGGGGTGMAGPDVADDGTRRSTMSSRAEANAAFSDITTRRLTAMSGRGGRAEASAVLSDITVGGDSIATGLDGGISGRADGSGTGMAGPDVADDGTRRSTMSGRTEANAAFSDPSAR
ncbi:hypothetical protein HDU89_008937 [Geranomyces variabilis]|nr:hypothetical protein HDU89_008937 [Geranomyces variabilis]